MATSNNFIENHFLSILIFIVCSVASFCMSVSDYPNMFLRTIFFYSAFVALYFICFGSSNEQTTRKVTSSSASSPPPPPPPAKPDEQPFWQFTPTKFELSKPSGEVERRKKRFEASERRRLAVEQAEREMNDPIFLPSRTVRRDLVRTPPNLRLAALLTATTVMWNRGSTATTQTTTAPAQTTAAPTLTAPAPLQPTPAPSQPINTTAPTTSSPATTPVAPPAPIPTAPELKPAAEKPTSEVLTKQTRFPYGTRPHTIHTNMHNQINYQYRRYLSTAETFPAFGPSLPGKCHLLRLRGPAGETAPQDP